MLIAPTIALDNSQGKGSRYKSVVNYQAYNFPFSIAVSNPANNTRRLRLAIVPNDNTNGKSSRFKRFAIERDRPLSIQLNCPLLSISLVTSSHVTFHVLCHFRTFHFASCLHVIARVLSALRFFNITITLPVSSGFQALCFLPKILRTDK